MDDEVADLEIAEVGEERLRGGPAPFVRGALLVEDVGLGPELERGIGQPEALRQAADGHQDRAGVRVFTAIDRRGRHLVVGQHLDDPLGPAGGQRHEHDRLTGRTRLAQLGRPSPRRARRIPCAGCAATRRTASSVPSDSVSSPVACSTSGASMSQPMTSDTGSAAGSFFADLLGVAVLDLFDAF